jgi:hypothetical protein
MTQRQVPSRRRQRRIEVPPPTAGSGPPLARRADGQAHAVHDDELRELALSFPWRSVDQRRRRAPAPRGRGRAALGAGIAAALADRFGRLARVDAAVGGVP